jgi:hypothetical protein
MTQRVFYATERIKMSPEVNVVVSKRYSRDRQELLRRLKPAPGTYSLGFYASRIGNTLLVRDMSLTFSCLKWRGTDKFFERQVSLKDIYDPPVRRSRDKRSIGIKTNFKKVYDTGEGKP